MFDQAFFQRDFFTLQILQGFKGGFGDDLIVAVGVIVNQNHHALGATRAGDQRVAVGHSDRIELARRKRIHRRGVIEPLEFHIDAGFLEPALVDGHLPGHPARPIAVTNFQRLGGMSRGGA